MTMRLIGSALILVAIAPAMAETASAAPPGHRIRFTAAYVHAICELEKADAAIRKDPDRVREDAERPAALLDTYKDALAHPYPPEIENDVPGSFDYAEHLLTEPSCPDAPRTEPSLPANFRCRLDHVIFRDPDKRQDLKAEGGNVAFGFLYDDPDERRFEETPRPLKAGPARVIGSILVRGRLKGKAYIIAREWVDGSPYEGVTSRNPDRKDPDDALMPPDKLPTVTAANAAMFVFDMEHDIYSSDKALGGPLREFRFLPDRCRR